MRYNFILHTTTFCNYNCSYCDVIKDWKKLNQYQVNSVINFIKENNTFINNFKFFWWEPLLSFDSIKKIIDNTNKLLWNKYQIVTNTSILNDEIWMYFKEYFEIVFFSIDSENEFDYKKVIDFIINNSLEQKIYFNLIISPWKEQDAYNRFLKLYEKWFKNFNILPVYFTKYWSKDNLINLSSNLKKIIDKSVNDDKINLYWFQINNGYNSSLINNSLFINSDLKVYYSDIVSTNLWKKIKDQLYISDLDNLSLEKIVYDNKKELVESYEKEIIKNIGWQEQLHKIMDYFSKYLNSKSN